MSFPSKKPTLLLSYSLPNNPFPRSSMNISLFHFQTPKIPNRLSYSSPQTSTLKCSSISKLTELTNSNPTIPARDRVIDFGKHKGKPLGALPSSYLKWVSKNLRARDFEDWAKLADQVLQDPVYQDRVEWEFAQNVLHGNRASFSNTPGNGRAVSELLEISERFGWDNEDKAGWSRVDFELLGTSKSGRIPRLAGGREGGKRGVEKRREEREEKGVEKGEEKRRERRERARLKKGNEKLGNKESGVGFQREKKVDKDVKIHNPFPGRERLLKDVLQGRRFL